MSLILILLAVIAFIVVATTKYKLHPFLALLLSAFIAAFAYGLPSAEITKVIASGFGGILGYIGLVIVLGTIIGIILEKSGAAITMADWVIKVLGERFPTLTMTIIGYIVSIPVFCDSGFVILNSLRESLATRMKTSGVAMSVALAAGLYATHTFIPPTPGPIAAAGNLGLESNLGLVIFVGIFVAAGAALAGTLWANRFKDVQPDVVSEDDEHTVDQSWKELKASYGTLPSASQAFAPIFVPILLICFSSIAKFPSLPIGEGIVFDILVFLGQPITATADWFILIITFIKIRR